MESTFQMCVSCCNDACDSDDRDRDDVLEGEGEEDSAAHDGEEEVDDDVHEEEGSVAHDGEDGVGDDVHEEEGGVAHDGEEEEDSVVHHREEE